MIRFTEKDNGKQFVSIEIKDSTPTETLSKKLKITYAALQQRNIIYDDSEIVIEINNGINYGFSLNELRKHIKSIATVNVTHFCVDIDEPTQRYCG